MERAMGYAGEFADKAEDYQRKAEVGMKEDAKEAREKAKAGLTGCSAMSSESGA